MQVLMKSARFVYTNRRTIGTIVGLMLTLAGYSQEGELVQALSEH